MGSLRTMVDRQGTVKVELEDVIEGDFEYFLDLLSEGVTGHYLLQNITYRIVGFEPPTTIIFEVKGETEVEKEEPDGEEPVAEKVSPPGEKDRP